MQAMRSFSLVALVAMLVLAPAGAKSADVADPSTLSAALKELKWRPIGPANMGGRVTDIVGLPGNPKIFYVAGADGGVFKTTNGGVTFEALFTDQKSFSVGALAVAPSDHNVLWLGSGEGDPRNSIGFGHGVYRSTDAGKSWSHLGLPESERIKRIVVHPADPDTAWVCALGHAWGANEQRGVFRTRDGGANWEKVLYRDADTGCSDIALDLSNPRILYAGMWTFRRRPWRFDDGGGETALYRSMDGGTTWKRLEKGLPKGDLARIGVSIAQSQPETVYMITESVKEGTLFRSDDRGDSWRMVSDERSINFRPFYYSDIRVDPNNPDHVYSLSGGLFKSTDGGKNFDRIGRGVHGDHQALWIDPLDSDRVLSGSDGGYQVSFDSGNTWDIINNVVLSQFYQLNLDDQDPYYVCGGLQDNGTWCGPSQSTHSAGILKSDWYRITGGDGYYAVPVPGRPHQIFSNLQGGVIFFTDLETGTTRTIHPYPKIIGSAGDAIADHRYRFNWDSPIHISPHDPDTVYFGGNVLFKTTDQGFSWDEISPDLTTNDKSKQLTSGGKIYQDNTAAEFHCTILTIAESPLEAGVIWVGTDDGNIQVTRNGGRDWSNVSRNVPDLPANSWIAKIDASAHRAGTAYVAVDNHRSDLFQPFAYKTDDYGKSWTPLHAGLPQDDYVKVIREDPRNPNLLYAGMEHGIFASWDGGKNWADIRNNMPPVSVRDLKVHPREHDLVAATHGRGIWVLDDIRPLQDLTEAIGKAVHLFPVRPATRRQIRNQTASLGQRTYQADNPPYGATIDFFLLEAPEKEKPDGGGEESGERQDTDEVPAKLIIKDQQGGLVREIPIEELNQGVNRHVWDLRFEGVDRQRRQQGPPGRRRGSRGPRVTPGTYQVTLELNGKSLSRDVQVLPDPRQQVSSEEYLAQVSAGLELLDFQEETAALIRRIEEIQEQFASLEGSLKAARRSREEGSETHSLPNGFDAQDAIQKIGSARKAFNEFRDETLRRPMAGLGYRQRPRLEDEIRSLMSAIDSAAGRPSEPQLARIEELRGETDQAKAEYQRLYEAHLKPINKMLEQLPAILTTG